MRKNMTRFIGHSRWSAAAVVLASCALISSRAYGGLVAEWDLNSPSYTGGTPSGMQADYGSQAGSASTTLGGSTTSPSLTQFVSGTGTTVNSPSIGTAGNAIVMGNFSGALQTMTLTFHLVGTGLSGFVMTYATQEQDAFNESQSWSWSTGSGYTALTSIRPGANSTWGAQSIDFSSATGLNNASDVYLQLQVSASDPFGVYFDNFKINATAVPEVPITGAVMGFGALAIALGHTLRRKFRLSV